MKDWLKRLHTECIELDQRLETALRMASQGGDEFVSDAKIFQALVSLNTRGLEGVPRRVVQLPPSKFVSITRGAPLPLSAIDITTSTRPIVDRAIRERAEPNTLGSIDFLRVAVHHALAHTSSGDASRGWLSWLLSSLYTGQEGNPLDQVPQARALLERLNATLQGPSDYQFFLTFSGNRIVFRVASVLGDHVHENDSGIWTPNRALISHLGEIGLFTSDQVLELEELINSQATSEGDLQAFFERNPHFLRRWDFREVHPHVYLTRSEDGPLVPDFILTNRDAHDAAVIELKRAKVSRQLIRRQHNRDRFSDAIMEARAQLLTYRDWFESQENRASE